MNPKLISKMVALIVEFQGIRVKEFIVFSCLYMASYMMASYGHAHVRF
jgi:hypothetical protein